VKVKGDNVSERVAESGKVILLYHPINTKSHRNQQNAIAEGLLSRGHRVIGVYPQSRPIENPLFTEIVVEDRLAPVYNFMTETMMTQDYSNPIVYWSVMGEMMKHFELMLKRSAEDSRMVIEKLKLMNVTPDAITTTIQFHWASALVFDTFAPVPLIGLSPPGNSMHVSKFLGNIENPSYMPELQLPFVEPLTFGQRLANTISYAMQDYDCLGRFWWPIFFNIGEWMDMDMLINQIKRMDILLTCSHYVTQSAQVTPPNIIEIGGVHCAPGKPLPQNLQQIMDSSSQGVILVSFGSAVKPSQMTKERRAIFLEVFSQLEEYTIIWKWDEEEVEGLPPNVVLSKWLPQQDLLAHPNLRVFVTHGGLLSLQEALYHKTPLVGIPLGNDQKPNLLRAEARGYAVLLDWANLSADLMLQGIQKALVDPEMKASVERQHRLFMDRPMSAQDTAVWWIEHAMRHGGGKHLRPASLDLTFVQYYLLDVIGFILIILVISLVIFLKLLLCVFRCCCTSRRKSKTD